MRNLNLAGLEPAGEKHVEIWLIDNGYTNIIKETVQPDEVIIKATGTLENIIIRVKTFLHPHNPFKLSEYDVDRLTRKAINIKHVPYAAYVVLDDKYDLAGEIIWERLS